MLKRATFHSAMRLLCIALLMGLSSHVFAQVTGVKTIPADYPTIAAFITDINTNGVGSGGATLQVPSGYTETSPAGGFTITATGTGANPIVITGVGGAPKPIITASGALTAGALNDAIFKIIGGDNITISNFELRENAANTTTTAASNNMTEWGIALLYATTTDGSRNCTLSGNTISLGATYQNAFGIYANATHSAGAVSTSATATTLNGGNSGLVVVGNTISNVNNGVVIVGPTAAVDFNDGITIGTAANPNTITYGLTGTFSSFANVSGTSNGILVRNSININVQYNNLSSNGTLTAGTLNGILLPAFSSTPTGAFTQTISNNTINILSANTTGSVVGISQPSGSASTTSTCLISNNNFTGFGHGVAGASGTLTFISTASTHFTTNINSNLFTNLSVNTTGSVTFVSHSFTIPVGGSSTASNNSIVTQFTKTGGGGTVTGFTTGASSPNSATYTLSNNNFSNINLTGATTLTFISNSDGAGSACAKSFTGNTLSNVIGGTNAITGLSVSYWGGSVSTIANNNFTNITGQGSITGINVGSSFSGSANTTIQNNTLSGLVSTGTGSTVTGIFTSTTAPIVIGQNNLHNFSSTGASLVTGITASGGNATSISSNKIYGLSSSNAGGTVFGINLTSGATISVVNNLISDLTATIASGADVIRGISVSSTSTGALYTVAFNTIYLNTSSTGANFGTSGIFHTVNATATTAALDLRNNIVINESTPAGTGLTVAFRRSGIALNNFASTSNRNLLHAGAAGATRLLMYDGTNSYPTIVAYQTAVLPREANSFAGESPYAGLGYGTAGNFFVSVTGSSADFLRPVGSIVTQVESGANNISGITTDYTSSVRAGNAGYVGTGTSPDIGAYEFEGTTPAPIITLNSVTPSTTSQCVSTARLVSVNITTASGTIVNATIGYSINGVPQTNIVMTNTSGNTWEGTIPVPSPSNATIAWGVAATNSLGINASYVGTTYADEPLVGVTASASASATPICASSPTTLTASLSKSGTSVTGSGSGASSSSGISPFYHGYGGVKTQYIFRASELTAMGFSAGNITALALNITSLGTTTMNSFSISMGHTAQNAAVTNTAIVSGLTQVYSNAAQTLTLGANNYVFSTPFNWDGTSNIVISFNYSNVNTGGSSSTVTTDPSLAFTSSLAIYADNASESCLLTAISSGQACMGSSVNTTSSVRPLFTITGNKSPLITSISWSDGVGTVGTSNPVTVNPTVTTTYTASIISSGCTLSPSPTVSVTVNPLPSAPTATNSAQCGVQIPSASVTSTSGLPTPTFNWYAASTGGTALQSNTSTTYLSTVGVTTTFYVSELNAVTGCESPRVAVTITVSTPDAISITPSSTAICVGNSVSFTLANAGSNFQNYTYSTECATAGSGAVTPISGATFTVTPTSAGTFTYTATGVDGGCAATASTTVTVNSLPVIASATATPAVVCSGEPIALSATATTALDGPFVVGNGALNGSSNYYSPFYHSYGGVKSQYIVLASELTAAGLTAGNITSMALNIGSVGTTYGGFTIHVGSTASTNLSGGLVALGTLTQVYSAATLTLTPTSLNTYAFSTPYVWDGVSNIVIQTSWSNVNFGGSSSAVEYDNTAYVSCAYFRADNTSVAGILGATTATGTLSSRPKMTFTMTHNNLFNWSWAPSGAPGNNATTFIVNISGAPVNQTYTVTATNIATGCTNTMTTGSVAINPVTAAPLANNSTQCGTGVPTASVTGSGTPGNTFGWYLVPTGGTALAAETGNTLSAYSISTTTTFYVAEFNGTCYSARTPVTVTVNTPPAIVLAGTTTICNGSSTTLSVSSTNDPDYTYNWSGGLGAGASVTAAPTSNTTYTVTASDVSGGANNGCVTNASITITVNPVPVTAPITPATAAVCNGVVQQLTVPVSASGTAILGNGTTAPSASSFPNPLSAFYGGTKHQMIFTAAELTAQGMVAGSKINALSFDLNAFSANACADFTIRIGNTALNALTGFVAGTTTVYGPTTFTPSSTGIVTFTLTTSYTWDGVSNIVVETVHNQGNSGNGSGTRTNSTTTPGNTVFYGSSDNVAGGIAGFDALTSWGTSGTSNSRPNMRFAFTNIQPTWTPVATLYSDAAATIPYVAGTSTGSVYAKPNATTTYTATFTGENGCTASVSSVLTVNQPTTSSITASACGSYTLNSQTYTVSGVYVQNLTNVSGCDSTITVNLTINQLTGSTQTVSACSSYTWAENNTTYTTSGTYTHVLPGANANGCDSTITLVLTIDQPATATQTVSACTSYTWAEDNVTYTSSGVYTHTIVAGAVTGCDSIITLNLTINQPTTGVDVQEACGSFTWIDGVNYVASNNTATFTIVNGAANGCDSVVTLNLTINQSVTGTDVQTACGSFTWIDGITYTASNSTATHTIVGGAANGCDSIVTLNLTINALPTPTITNNNNGTITSSAGTTYQWINCTTNTPIAGATAQTFAPTVNGSYAVIVSNALGCSDTSACMTINDLSVGDIKDFALQVHPNPTTGVVTVVYNSDEKATVVVMDASGKQLRTQEIVSQELIDLGAYDRGVYFLRISTGNNSELIRIVKQ